MRHKSERKHDQAREGAQRDGDHLAVLFAATAARPR